MARSTLTPEETTQAILGEIHAVDPSLNATTVCGIVDELAPLREKRTMLLRHFERYPGLLTSGDPRIPVFVQRLIKHLTEAGSTVVVRPSCAICDGVKLLPRLLPDGRRACEYCGARGGAKPCSRCGKIRIIARRTGDEQLCLRCYRHDPASHKTCAGCGRDTYAVVRTPAGPLCTTCAPRKHEACGQCGQDRPRRAVLLGGAICPVCYEKLRRTPATCPVCSQTKVLAYLDDDDQQRICASCAGQDSPFACEQCGREDHQYGRRCAVCVLTDRATVLLACKEGTVHHELTPVLDAMLAVDRPKSTLFWLQQSEGPALLRRMATGELPISHAALDALPRTRALDYLRDFLMAVGVLPLQVVELERLIPWLDELLGGLPAAHARIVQPYARWHVLRRARTKAERGQLTTSGARNDRTLIRAAIYFLTWLTEHDATLTTARQPMLDAYLTEHPSHHRYLGGFITWAHDRRLVSDLRTPSQQRSHPEVTLADDDRWSAVERLLHDDTLALDVRVAGLFILLYGQPVSRTCRMTPSQINTAGTHVTVRFADDPIQLPDPLDSLVLALLHRRGRASYASKPDRWLFPGGQPGHHRTAETLRIQLATTGVTARPARNAALIQLAAEVPAPILADLLGINPGTAVIWASLASRDWASYAAQRRNSAHNE